MTILVASTNRHKLAELQALLPVVSLKTPMDLGLSDFDVEENGSSFAENAWLKASALWNLTGQPVLADDSGICVDALGGRPGIHSARYGSRDGQPVDAAERNRLLLAEMRGIKQRSCRFVCCLTLLVSAQRFFTVQEVCEGLLLEAPRGSHGFGYDPVVYLPELDKTVAELDPAEKNRYSHRGKAMRRLQTILADL